MSARVSSAPVTQGRRTCDAASSRRQRVCGLGLLVILACFSLSVKIMEGHAQVLPEEGEQPTFKYVTASMLSQFIVIFLIAVTALIGIACLSNIDVPAIYSNRTLDINKEY
ncbi:hypothetical protein BESB_059870 [Besnoitia besnoiti]|uniref:Transmembrane protein n=1 Tax=Besnoitia besnoiti TaxID=94643 RepID=A0A2A9MI73_BESBE|nr:hypothetical protein BESB_059870 [Besnoitia besnoiti]PFH35100.1 hypothetical protein BESB_059870 [Besnoitia besnoiti]